MLHVQVCNTIDHVRILTPNDGGAINLVNGKASRTGDAQINKKRDTILKDK